MDFLLVFSVANTRNSTRLDLLSGGLERSSMKVFVEAKNLVVTPALRRHVEQHTKKLQKIGKKIVEVRVFLETIAKKSNDPTANRVIVSVSLPGKAVVVRKQAVDMYEAIVDAAHSASRRVRKEAEKRITRMRGREADRLSATLG